MAAQLDVPPEPELVTGKYIRDAPPLPGWKKRPYEVYFANCFTPCCPWGEMPRETIQNEALSLPIQSLCHATHKKQACQIDEHSEERHFMPHKKLGKSTTEGRSRGESYHYISPVSPPPHEDTPCYQVIPSTEPVFPGFYSWWGLSTQGYRDMGLLDGLSTVPLPTYLKDAPESWYGDHAFYVKFSDLLTSYRISRQSEDIYLKIGGTLRYGHEICYVVIVCTEKDLHNLHTFSSITREGAIFTPNDLVGDDGKVINIMQIPHFNTRYVNAQSSYETLTFAFYFNSKEEHLVCNKGACQVNNVAHPKCISQEIIPCWFELSNKELKTKTKCPNKITDEDRETQRKVMEFADCYGVSWP